MRFASIAFSIALGSACTVNVDLEAKSCPCAEGYSCVDGKCVAESPCAVGVTSFRAAWATPHAIRWEWEPTGEEKDFQEYRLIIGPTESDVKQRTSLAQIWTSAENAELGVFILRRTGAEEKVRGTITDGLTLNQPYRAELEIVDSSGCVARTSNVAGKSTTDATGNLPLMTDAAWCAWGSFEHVTGGCSDGSPGCWHASTTCDVRTSCYANLRCDFETALDTNGALTDGNFSTAYVGFQVRNVAKSPSWWGNVTLNFGITPWAAEPIILQVGEYRRMEVPLAALAKLDTIGTVNPDYLTFGGIQGQPLQVFQIGLDTSNGGGETWVENVELGW